MIQGKSASQSTPQPEIITLKIFSIVPKFETPDFMDRLNPETDKRNFNQITLKEILI